MPAEQKNGKIDWENIEIIVVPAKEPNPQNPYTQLSPQARQRQIKALCEKIVFRKALEPNG